MDRASKGLPICLELMDTEANIRHFLAKHEDDLTGVRTILFRCECL
jgi:PII-like signaling protein